MKRFQFRLDKLLRLKRQKDRQAELRQISARQAWEAARQQADALYEQLVQSASAVEARIGQTIETNCWVAQYQHITQVRLAVDIAEANAKRAGTVLEEANRIRRITAVELESLQILRQQQWQQYRKDSALDEQQRLDDVYLQRIDLSSDQQQPIRNEAGGLRP